MKKATTILATMVIVASIAIIFIHIHFSSIGTDGVFYALMAKSIVEEGNLNVYGVPHTIYSPLLPIMIAVPYALGVPLESAAHIPVIVCALAGILGVYVLTRKIHEEEGALLAALFLGTSGMYIWSAGVNTSPQYVAGLFALFATITLLYMRDRHGRSLFLASAGVGFALGLAYLARPEYFFLAIFVPFYVFLLMYRRLTKIALLTAGVSLLSFIAVSSPYLFYLHDTLGYWTVSGRGNELAVIVSTADYESVDALGKDGVSTVMTPPTLRESAILTVWEELPSFLKHSADGLINTEVTFLRLFGLLGVGFFALGVRHLLIGKKFSELVLFCLFLSPIVLVAIAQGGSPNYLVQYFYLITPLVAIGIIETMKEFGSIFHWDRKRTFLVMVSILGILVLRFALPALQNALFLPADYRDIEYKVMGLWMKDYIPDIEKEIVVSRKPEPTFYAGSRWSIVPNAKSIEELLEIMKKRGQRYVIADDRNLPSSRPELAELLIPGSVPSDFRLVHTVEYEGKRAFLYEIVSFAPATGW